MGHGPIRYRGHPTRCLMTLELSAAFRVQLKLHHFADQRLKLGWGGTDLEGLAEHSFGFAEQGRVFCEEGREGLSGFEPVA